MVLVALNTVIKVIVIIGLAAFSLLHGYIGTAIVCVAGFSKKFGWPALILVSVSFFLKGHFWAGYLPLFLIGWNVFYFSRVSPRDWRRIAVVIVAAYLVELEKWNGDQRIAFLNALEFQYKPETMAQFAEKQEISGYAKAMRHYRYRNVLHLRLYRVLIAKGFSDVIERYLNEHRLFDLRPDDTDILPRIWEPGNSYFFTENDYSPSELVYCMLVIEFPFVVAGLEKEQARVIIDDLLQRTQNKISVTARNPQLVSDLETIARM